MFQRIETNPNVLGGKPCIKGTRISVEFICELLASGASRDDILRAYPRLSADAIDEAVRYASDVLKKEAVDESHRLSAEKDDDLADTYAAQIESAMRAGWGDPSMDEYNDY